MPAPVAGRWPRASTAGPAPARATAHTGSCGTCRVRVVRGFEHASPPGPEERDFLATLDAPPDHRLACQMCVNGDLEIEYLGL